MSTFNILDHGAIGDAQTNDAAAIQKAIDAAHAAGGGTVLVPAGKTFVTGTIYIKSHVNFHVEGGAQLVASDQEADYPNRIMIEAIGAENIALTGTGLIDGRARLFMTMELPYIFRGNPWRPRLIGLTGCKGVVIEQVTLKDSANWGLHLTGCENVVIHGITILNDLKVPNCDGIDPDHCRNVRISDCHIEAGDDCIVIKNTREFAKYGPTENITVTGCTLKSTSAAIKIGTESVSDFRNLVFADCVISGTNRGLAIQLRDEGNIENVLFSNIIIQTRLFDEEWWGRAEPIYVTAFPRTDATVVGTIRHVRFSNILASGENGAYIAGMHADRIEDVILENVRIEIVKTSKWAGGKYDRRPGVAGALVEHKTNGFYCEYARDLTLRNCRVAWGTERPDYFGHALEAHHIEGLVVENFRGEAGHPVRDAAQVIS